MPDFLTEKSEILNAVLESPGLLKKARKTGNRKI